MARRMPKGLELWKPAYQTVAFHGVPMYRCQAWALHDYELHNRGSLFVNSANRVDSVIRRFNKKHHTNLHSQKYLFDHQNEPGFFPANRPENTSHALHADGNKYYGPPGRSIPRYKLGIDATTRPGGDAEAIVRWLNAHGYHAVRPYAPKVSERHHFSFMRSPATNARKRLRRWKKTGR